MHINTEKLNLGTVILLKYLLIIQMFMLQSLEIFSVPF